MAVAKQPPPQVMTLQIAESPPGQHPCMHESTSVVVLSWPLNSLGTVEACDLRDPLHACCMRPQALNRSRLERTPFHRTQTALGVLTTCCLELTSPAQPHIIQARCFRHTIACLMHCNPALIARYQPVSIKIRIEIAHGAAVACPTCTHRCKVAELNIQPWLERWCGCGWIGVVAGGLWPWPGGDGCRAHGCCTRWTGICTAPGHGSTCELQHWRRTCGLHKPCALLLVLSLSLSIAC